MHRARVGTYPYGEMSFSKSRGSAQGSTVSKSTVRQLMAHGSAIKKILSVSHHVSRGGSRGLHRSKSLKGMSSSARGRRDKVAFIVKRKTQRSSFETRRKGRSEWYHERANGALL